MPLGLRPTRGTPQVRGSCVRPAAGDRRQLSQAALVGFAAFAAVASLALVPASKADGLTRVDWIGGALSVVAVGGVVYAIIDGFHFGWSLSALGALGTSVVAAVAFVAWELRHPQPLLNLRRVADRAVGGACISVLLLFFATFGLIYFVAQQFQFVLGYGPLETGLRLLPLAGSVSVGAALGGRLVPRFGARILVACGMVATSAGVLLLAALEPTSGYGIFLASLLLVGLGIGLATPPATDLIMGGFPDTDLGAAGGLNDTAVEFGGSVGIALLGSVLATSYHDEIAGFLSRRGTWGHFEVSAPRHSGKRSPRTTSPPQLGPHESHAAHFLPRPHVRRRPCVARPRERGRRAEPLPLLDRLAGPDRRDAVDDGRSDHGGRHPDAEHR